jgi:hypothetical protein
MKITKLTLLILMFVLMLSIFVANVANIIDVDSHALGKETAEGIVEVESRWSKPKKYDIGDSHEHLLWFLQVSSHCSNFVICITIAAFIEKL